MKKKLICLLVLCISSACFAQGSSISPYITQYWRSVLGFDTPIHQPIAGDSTTFFQILDANGDLILNGDSTNRQVTIGQTSATYPFLINSTDASDQIKIYHTNGDTWLRTTDGGFNFQTDEGTNTNTTLKIFGKGTGYGRFQFFDQDNLEWITMTCAFGIGFLSVEGTSPAYLSFQPAANVPIYMFESATEGETQKVSVYGFGTGSGGKESFDTTVEKYTANTVEFEGLDYYRYTGMVRQTTIWHAYGGFEDQAEVIACGVGDWNWITNGDPWDLWTCDEEDGISCALDVFTIANTGDYMGNLSVSISGLNGKDFHVRVYNNTQTRVEGRPIGISTTGANNEMNISVPVYIEATAGDEIQFEIMSADGTDPVVDDALFWISYLHD